MSSTTNEPDLSTRPVVATRSGAVRGIWRDRRGSRSAAFLGIPFAKAPVGALRFRAPEPAEPWDGELDASEYGATAQRGDLGPTLIPEPSIPGASTLNANVFTPRPQAGASLPVMVYIHGGGFFAGSPASPWYDGFAFNRDDVVTVTLSYRLGIDGFAAIPGAPSNRGVRDWLLGLEWVRDNVAAFGGDPSRVTIAGQSAGGGAVLTLLGMPAAQSLFQAAWSISGAIADIPLSRAEALTRRVAELAGVSADRDGFASLPEQRLYEMQQAATNGTDPAAMVQTLLDGGLSWGPVVDGDLITRPTLESIAAGVGADKPLVIGALDDEFTMITDDMRGKLRWVPASVALRRMKLSRSTSRAYLRTNRAQRARGTAAVLGRYFTDHTFRTLVVKVARARGEAPTWVYRFVWSSPARGWAVHCLDVPFWFDCLDGPDIAQLAGHAPPQELADDVHRAAVSLVATGEAPWPAWPAVRVFDVPGSSPSVIRSGGYAEVEPLLSNRD